MKLVTGWDYSFLTSSIPHFISTQALMETQSLSAVCHFADGRKHHRGYRPERIFSY
jgi:hypothetical protein